MMVSVCMTTYNGSKYVGQQIASILHQLGNSDELIVCDDRSSDDTVERVEAFSDSRIIVIRNEENLGHVKNFEKALSYARGDLIFLSDQDDVWHPNKVSYVRDLFNANSGVDVVHHGMTRVDADGLPLLNSRVLISQFRSRHVVVSQFLKSYVFGCCIAMRRDFLRYILPFPESVYAHDHWIALTSGVHSSFLHTNEALIEYRIHGGNLTPKASLPFLKKVKLRLIQLRLWVIAFARKI